MFLKQLEVMGFKSFAERISVEFVPGVTAVVGPNGSGKSNIIDAIRWVLGEQSAKSLRGSKMEDVIFAGSDSRKALNIAEVTLVLDNEDGTLPIDYSEISVTRRVFRSGDSEYLLNKQPCRLKDIIELFMDSGLGKEAFSIISQGKVEEILNSKPEERRTIFEEAAGVLKYKTRKKKAENKLFETQENLNRVNDILHELEGQVEPLKIQASMARDYLEKKEELEKFEVALTVYDIEDLHKQWEKLSEEFEHHGKEELALSTRIQKKEAVLTQTRDKIAALDESISNLQEVLLATSEELEKLEGRKQVLVERKKNSSSNETQLKQSIEEAEEQIQQLTSEKEKSEMEFKSIDSDVKELKELLVTKQNQFKHYNENIEDVIESFKSDYIEKLNQQASAKNEIQYLEQQLEQQSNRSGRLEAENEKYVIQRDELHQSHKELSKMLQQQKEIIDEHIFFYREEQQKLESVKAKYEKQEKTLYQAFQFLQQAKSRKEMLEEMEDDYTGFFQGVKEVLKERDGQLTGVRGAVAELITVPKTYETAMETALAASMQHIVVDTEEDGRKAIAFLKKNQYGRATFLPMSVIKGKSIPDSQKNMLKGHSSFIGVGTDLLNYEERFQMVISNLVGNVIITEDLKGANEIAKLIQYRYRLVTLDGDVVNPGGSMSGGTVKQKKNSLLSRKGELEEMKEKLTTMESQTEQLQSQVKSLKEESSFREKKLEEMRVKGERLRLKEQELLSQLRENELSQQNLDERLSLYDLEKKDFTSVKEKHDSRTKELRASLDEIGEDIKRLDQKISELTLQKNSERTSKDALLNEISDIKANLAVRNEQLVNSRNQLIRVQETIVDTNKRKATLQDDLEWLQTEMKDNFSGEEQLGKKAEECSIQKSETSNLITIRREERLNLQHAVEDEELELKELKRQHKGLVGALRDEEVKINRLDVELENRLDHLRDEYMLSFEAAKSDYPLTIEVEEARKKVKLVKLALEELGTVNLGAIDEYERVKERYEFLVEQKNDLTEAKDTLYLVINEMDTEMIKRFDQTFTAIQVEFEGVFRALFGGGRAQLKLTDPSDLLHTGVDIVAQPPGKKLQNLGLMSGGERALTAIALLFSILKIRPVPFCILDEVEAALDEANVQRFSQYLKKFSDETQFIVITHRKGTMEEAHVLYGVTMQESGVSKLVSVRLQETKELLET
ncbi:chromosome segregation protein SMC [Rossellomorea aquimaris]|uniref:Chromosome partition protein Smc n=1 Tax=Rossellomorea aquimaris TaxID=189382 RepID=A0A5D4TZQ0_9BACI|nr:chromosome segregation protein SMC [Rossellomorea aquimaris]TYS80496.1 chromosome segregation protein SMC [Rossellomorea aquimaris]TYS85882.1 chromosome segregation protein SMC [Rossellomorea aquimaris]